MVKGRRRLVSSSSSAHSGHILWGNGASPRTRPRGVLSPGPRHSESSPKSCVHLQTWFPVRSRFQGKEAMVGRDCPGGAFLGGPSPQNMAPISSLTLGSLSKPRTSYSLVRSWYFKCRTSDSLTDIQYEVSGLMKKPFF